MVLGMSEHETLRALVRARAYAADGRARKLREGAALSVRDMARLAGVSPTCLFRWETGSRSPRGDAAVRYGRLLGDLEELAGVSAS